MSSKKSQATTPDTDQAPQESPELLEMRKLLQEAKDKIAVLTGTVEPTEPEVELVRDPYSEHDALSITGEIPPDETYPEGQVLTWLSPAVRDRLGWNGWIALEWGDEYTGKDGEKLIEYGIQKPPENYAGGGKIDSLVRMGDVILGRLDKRWYNQRVAANLEKSNRQRQMNRSQGDLPLEGTHGTLSIGKGLERDPSGAKGAGYPITPGTVARVPLNPQTED